MRTRTISTLASADAVHAQTSILSLDKPEGENLVRGSDACFPIRSLLLFYFQTTGLNEGQASLAPDSLFLIPTPFPTFPLSAHLFVSLPKCEMDLS